MECETQESEAGYTKHLNLHYPKTYNCRYKINQHLIALKLGSVSITKSIAPQLVTVKVPQDLNLMQNMSIQWNRQPSRYVSKVIEYLENIRKQIDNKKDYQIQSKCTDYKIFELKYGNTKHNQVKLVLQFFFLLICTNIGLNYINQAQYNQWA